MVRSGGHQVPLLVAKERLPCTSLLLRLLPHSSKHKTAPPYMVRPPPSPLPSLQTCAYKSSSCAPGPEDQLMFRLYWRDPAFLHTTVRSVQGASKYYLSITRILSIQTV